MLIGLIVGAIFVLLFLPVPVAIAMLLGSSGYYIYTDTPLEAVAQRMVSCVESIPLLAVPFFILAGELMNASGITDRLVRFSNVLVGRFAGGLGHVVVVSNVVMSGISGSAAADAVGTGSVLVQAMVRRGYPAAFAAAIVGASSTIAPIIPPSIPLVIFGAVAEVSTSRLLLAGILPGLLMGAFLLAINAVLARRRGYPREAPPSFREFRDATLAALPPLGMPVVIVGGIVAGIFTPTEASVTAVGYALVLGVGFYRTLGLREIWGCAVRVSTMTGAIMLLVGGTTVLGDIVTRENVSDDIVALLSMAHDHPYLLLGLVNIVLMVIAIPLEPIPVMLLFVPLLLPVMTDLGVDPVHFGILMVLSLCIAFVLPPAGLVMFIMCSIAQCSMAEFTRQVWPFVIVLLVVLALLTYWPGLALFVPNALLPVRGVG